DALTAAKVRYVAAGSDAWARRARHRGGISAFHADHGVSHEAYGPYLESLGWRYTSTKHLPPGKGGHLRADELPPRRLMVQLPNHLVAVIEWHHSRQRRLQRRGALPDPGLLDLRPLRGRPWWTGPMPSASGATSRGSRRGRRPRRSSKAASVSLRPSLRV